MSMQPKNGSAKLIGNVYVFVQLNSMFAQYVFICKPKWINVHGFCSYDNILKNTFVLVYNWI